MIDMIMALMLVGLVLLVVVAVMYVLITAPTEGDDYDKKEIDDLYHAYLDELNRSGHGKRKDRD